MTADDGREPDGVMSFLHESERGDLRISLETPTLLLFKYRGYTDATFVPFIERVYAITLGTVAPPHYIFVDCESQTGFAYAFQVGITNWSKRSMPLTDAYWLLVKSRIVAMGITLARVALGAPGRRSEVTSSRSVFDAKLSEAMVRSRASGPARARADSPREPA